jgi:hypothetical protein
MTDRAERDRLRALCDAATADIHNADDHEDALNAFLEACDPDSIRSLLNAADERDRAEMAVIRIANKMAALRAAAEQARKALAERSACSRWALLDTELAEHDRNCPWCRALAALDAVLEPKEKS